MAGFAKAVSSYIAQRARKNKKLKILHPLETKKKKKKGILPRVIKASLLLSSGLPEIQAPWCLFLKMTLKWPKLLPAAALALSRTQSPHLVLAIIKTLCKGNTPDGGKHWVKFTHPYTQVSVLHITSSPFPH